MSAEARGWIVRQPSRRDVLRITALGAGSLAVGSLASACRSPAPAPAASGPAATLAPFRPTSDGSSQATGLPRRLAWVPTANSEFFVAFGQGMAAAAKDRGLDFVTATSGDSHTNVADLDSILARGVGALAFQPLDPAAQSPSLTRAIQRGVCVQGIITHPCTMQIAAGQYDIGYRQGKAAADYARARLGGSAQVCYFNLDTVSAQLRLRHRGVLDGLRTGGSGVRVVSDLTVTDISTAAGFATMNTVLQAHPGVNVVLGGDTLVVGAYNALKQAGKLAADMYLAGVDGDRAALDLVAAAGPYRASVAFPWQLMGYGMGQFGADWIAGRPVPRVLVAKGTALTDAAGVERFRTANADPAAVFADLTQYQRYLPLLGSVDYAQRGTYWTDEVTPP